jgi:hypothetical protein
MSIPMRGLYVRVSIPIAVEQAQTQLLLLNQPYIRVIAVLKKTCRYILHTYIQVELT